ncbi:hypothetical protein [Actinophytocola sp.]|uniref:hypothetical protein n=1 Tax=Actinophytocola sp. TaxID=1872138 RepID=UPI003D6B0F2D
MTFQRPDAVPFVDNADLAISGDEHSRDIIGAEPINTAVENTIPAYDEKLDLGLATSALERHSRLGGLAFGKLAKDVAKLKGLAAAVENISVVVRDGKARLAQDWKGESYDAFRSNIEKLEKTLNDYKAAVETTAAGLETALSAIRSGYQNYRDHCLNDHFNWAKDKLSKPGDWWRMSKDSGEYLAERCTSWHTTGCHYDDDELVAMIDGRLTTNQLFNEQLEKWDCTDDLAVVTGQYRYVVDGATNEREAIHGKINAYCAEADELHGFVGKAYDESLNNLRILAEASVFSHLSVPGGTGSVDGSGGPGQADTGEGDGDPGGGRASGGDDSGGSGDGDAVRPPPSPNPAAEPLAAAEAPEPPGAAAVVVSSGDSVTIKDGDRTISVTSPDGAGHVKVTVVGGDGKATSYDLDFDAASGMAPPGGGTDAPAAGGAAESGAERVPAGTNGQCVIRDGSLVITAERPLFDPGTIKLEVDDGVNVPTTYTLDFDEATEPRAEEPDRAQGEPTDEVAEPGGSGEPKSEGEPAPQKEQLTRTQAVTGDPHGALSGVLVPDQSTGEAELASAGEGEPAGAAGGGAMPMMAGAGAGVVEGGRAGTGWSVHGDLFDNGDPVYSMHGVLGEDDLEGA